jgi:hypothetical protein
MVKGIILMPDNHLVSYINHPGLSQFIKQKLHCPSDKYMLQLPEQQPKHIDGTAGA